MVRGGNVNRDIGSLRRIGDTGYYWVVTAYASELYSYDLLFSSMNIYPLLHDARWYGFTAQTVKPIQRLAL